MQNITVEEVKQRLDAGEALNLVDVREPEENAEFNIGGVLHPLGRIKNMEVDELETLKEKEVICYCRSGNRSGMAALILETMGFQNVKNLTGGMLAWKERIGEN
ncbi:MAG: rhodanese-like domain-containing protein [Chitinophagaceae bacterium]|nr:rhodanese-like domain-containing protein [Chitinophagaceae bacterium]